MSFKLIRRAFEIGNTEGWISVVRKTKIYFLAKTVSYIATNLYEINSREYWNFRMKYDWNAVGGANQTQLFCASLFANIDIRKLENINSVLDFGCATGDSAPILRIFFPNASIYLYDLSERGLKKAINKYKRFLNVSKWESGVKVDFVYCSNVIEHVANPKQLVISLIIATTKYICIQCPYDEAHHNGGLISPENPVGEHIWTVNDDFFEKYIKDDRVSWTKSIGVVPMAWEGGKQVYFLGQLI
jgi:SAM-dependent methyltransferase